VDGVSQIQRVMILAFGRVHGLIGMPKQLLLFVTMLRVKSNADARFDMQVLAIQTHRLPEHLPDFPHNMFGILRRVNTVQQHHELVTTDARDGVGFAYAALESIGYGLQQHVPYRMTKGVVDLF
jgi:hypothetical protein